MTFLAFAWASESKLQMETLLPSLCTYIFVMYEPPSLLSTIGGCMGTSATGTGISSFGVVST